MRINELVYQRPLLHSAYLREEVLREEQLIEGLLDSAKSFLGTNFTKTIDDIKGNVTDLTQAAILLKDAFSCAPVFEVMLGLVGKYLSVEIKSFDNISKIKVPEPLSGVFSGFVAFIRKSIQKVSTLTGLVQFFSKLGLYALLKYINTFLNTPINIKDEVLSSLKDKVTELLGGVVSNLSLPGFLTFFNTLKTAKTYFLDLLTYIKKKIEAVPPKLRPQAKCANLNKEIKQVAEMAIRHSNKIITESLDAPYPIQVEPSPYEHDVNHYTAKTIMPNGKELEVNFVPFTEREKKYFVDFWVDGTQHLTGKGDQQRIFATVLSAIRQFIKMNSPDMLKFSAMKNKRYNDTNPMSRVNLYNKLVKKYAQSAGYDYTQYENEAQVSYTLTKKADANLNEVNIDNEKGWGEVPLNRSVDYHGLRVLMPPSVFLKLAAPDPHGYSAKDIEQHIKSGGAIASPFLEISIPNEWEDGDVSKLARIVGHEGRNRMKAIKAIEGDDPIEVHLFIRGGIRRRHITDEWIKSMQSGMYSEGTRSLIPGPLFTTF